MLNSRDTTDPQDRTPSWRRSQACNSASCVEVSLDGHGVQVRDSKDSDGPVLSFTRDEWDSFVTGVKNLEFEV